MGSIFGLTQQLAYGFRGINDSINSGIGGAVVGMIIATRQPIPYRVLHVYPIFFGVPAMLVHYGYNQWWEGEYDRAIKLNKTLKTILH
jgi:hypothetical protein